jgi:protein TonB
MFADSLLESAPHAEHRAAWTKLISALLQSTAVTIALTIPLLHLERLRVITPPPSIEMTAMRQRPTTIQTRSTMSSPAAAPAMREFVQPSFVPRTIPTDEDQPPSYSLSLLCTANCSAIPADVFTPPGTFVIPPPPTRPPSARPRVSVMQLGDLVRKVVPEYPAVAKQLHIEGMVVLLATIGRSGRVEQVQVLRGPALLQPAAKQAVEQWQYRPYVLNHEAIEVQTQITVNFVLNRE